MAHHATDHAPAHTGKMVIFSLLLFFVLTAAGHKVFVIGMGDHASPSHAEQILNTHEKSPDKKHK